MKSITLMKDENESQRIFISFKPGSSITGREQRKVFIKEKKKKKNPRTTETGDGFDRSNIKPSLNRA